MYEENVAFETMAVLVIVLAAAALVWAVIRLLRFSAQRAIVRAEEARRDAEFRARASNATQYMAPDPVYRTVNRDGSGGTRREPVMRTGPVVTRLDPQRAATPSAKASAPGGGAPRPTPASRPPKQPGGPAGGRDPTR